MSKMSAVLRFSLMLLASALPALTSPLLEERAVCNRDNLLRCYDPTGTKATDAASRSAATAFCSSYISIPVVTVVVSTSTPVSTVISTTTTTDGTAVVTLVSTSVSVQEITVVATASTSTPTVAKRDAVAAVAGPACAGTTYPASRLSSACSCLSVRPSTTRITATAPTSTNVIVATIHDTTTTTTETTTTTTSTSTTTTTSIAAAATTCGAPGSTCSIDNFFLVCCSDADGITGCAFPSGDPQNGVCFLP